MASKTALVITSIAPPNAALRAFARGGMQKGVDFILIGDKPSPKDFALDGCDFWSLERQRSMPFRLAAQLPERHYGRKNLGYLQAIAGGADLILESDDDNLPRPEFWDARRGRVEAEATGPGWVNTYRYFTEKNIWPRGFPLEYLRNDQVPPGAKATYDCPIQQGLADENPDVDAIYRLTGQLPLNFEKRPVPVALAPGSWCPFNSQNTTWFPEAFPLLYLPSHCSFRMTDIWRSYVAVRICRANGWHVLFHNASVWQERNEHDLMKDFEDELIGYKNNRAICERLDALEIEPGTDRIGANLVRCYEAFIAMKLVGEAERPLIEAWNADVEELRGR